jgi:hypothetical protein
MMQLRFTKLSPDRKTYALPEGASATEMAIGQLLGLAKSAGFRFDVVEGVLVPVSDDADWQQFSVLKTLLVAIGAEAVVSYFERNTPRRQETFSASA